MAAARAQQPRSAGPADAIPFAALHALCFQPGWEEAVMAHFIGDPDCICLVAGAARPLQGPSLQGLLIARIAADEAELLTIAVHPDHRRHGIAQSLMRIAIGQLKARGVLRLFLEVDEANAAAIGLYRGLDASPVGSRKAYYASGAAALILSLSL